MSDNEENANVECLKISGGQIPQQSIAEAELLLKFASQRGLQDFEEDPKAAEAVRSIVCAKHIASDAGKWNGEIEVRFWNAFDTIARKIAPVNIESLRALYPTQSSSPSFLANKFGVRPRSEAEKTVCYYRLSTIFFLVVLLCAQIYYSYGSAIVVELNRLPQEITKARDESRKIMAQMENMTDASKKATLEVDLQRQTATEEDARRKYNASQSLLESWRACIPIGIALVDHTSTPLKTDPAARMERTLQVEINHLQDAVFILQVIQSYLLPLLYGFLGSCAYILRTLSVEIGNVTFTPETRASYMTRLLLGGLSGLIIGWFVDPATVITVKTASPFALAFVAGYSVELVFAIMDKIISSLSSPAPQKPTGKPS